MPFYKDQQLFYNLDLLLCHLGTAWTWLHKIRMTMIEARRTPLKGQVEVDESHVFTGKGGKG